MKGGGKGIEKDVKCVNVKEFIDELYEALCLKLKGRALGMIKNLMDDEDVCGMAGWYKLSYDVQGFSGFRTQGLSNKVYNPTRLKSINDVTAGLEE